MRTSLPPVLSLAGFIFFSSHSAHATLFRRLDAEPPGYIEDRTTLTSKPQQWYYDDGYGSILYTTKGQQTFPWLSPSQRYAGTRSFAFDLFPTPAGSSYDDGNGTSTTDKLNLRVVDQTDPYAPALGTERYTGFALKLGSTGAPNLYFDLAPAKILLVQWWQGSPFEPPLRLELVNGSNPLRYRFAVRNETNEANRSILVSPAASPNAPAATDVLDRDVWYRFVVRTVFASPGPGRFTVWQARGDAPLLRVIDWSAAAIGYRPTWTNDLYDTRISYPGSTFGVFVGPYRDRQPAQHRVFFDEVKFADTFAEAVPQSTTPASAYATWAAARFTPNTPAALTASTADPDGDGASNALEHLAGTDPLDPASRLSLTLTTVTGGFRLTWPSVPGVNYTIETSADLRAWEPLAAVTAAPAPSITTTFLDLESTALPRFYRLRLTP